MKELLYFSFADLMASVELCHKASTLRYATHRKMSHIERSTLEQYLLASFIKNSNPHARKEILITYLGTDKSLVKPLEVFHSKNELQELAKKEVNDAVNELISRSMQEYYFEQIGDTILAARRDATSLQAGIASEHNRYKAKLEELIRAYNSHAGQKITIEEIVPTELKTYFGIPTTNRESRADRRVQTGKAIELAE